AEEATLKEAPQHPCQTPSIVIARKSLSHKFQTPILSLYTGISTQSFTGMHAGVIRDMEQQRVKKERQADFEMQKALEEEYKKVQTVHDGAGGDAKTPYNKGSQIIESALSGTLKDYLMTGSRTSVNGNVVTTQEAEAIKEGSRLLGSLMGGGLPESHHENQDGHRWYQEQDIAIDSVWRGEGS
ncbi:MAG: hypothetical protein Q9218_007810, partial [Villophora microphyllina]